MFCQKCGCILTEGARFCGNCGAEISPATATPQEQTADQAVTNNAPQGAQSQPTPAEAIMNEYHRAANAQSVIPQDIQPERYTVPDPVPEKKKRSRLVPGICIAAGALVVLGGAGALVPITGFANSVAATAHGFKVEGHVFGVGARIFQIAGPVILYGIFSSWILGLIYWFMTTLGM